jgi:hypothetical protein
VRVRLSVDLVWVCVVNRLSVGWFVCLFGLLVCLFICLFVCLFVCLIVCLFVSLFVCLLASLACLFVCWLVCLLACSFACLFVLEWGGFVARCSMWRSRTVQHRIVRCGHICAGTLATSAYAPGLFAAFTSAPGLRLAQGTVDVEHKGESTFFSVLVGERHFSSVEVRGALTPRDACEERPTAIFRTHWLNDRPLRIAGTRAACTSS